MEVIKHSAPTAQFWGLVFIFAVLALAGVFDLVAAFSGGKMESLSSVVGEWSGRWPIIPFAAGLLAGHLFWRGK